MCIYNIIHMLELTYHMQDSLSFKVFTMKTLDIQVSIYSFSQDFDTVLLRSVTILNGVTQYQLVYVRT